MGSKAALTLSDFDYTLPPERIAQEPLVRRDASRLLVYDRATGEVVEHARFRDLVRLLPPGSLLVLNDTRVLPARLLGRKISGGKVEVLLIRRESALPDDLGESWLALVKASKGLHAGMAVDFIPGFSATLVDIAEQGGGGAPPLWRVSFSAKPEVGGVAAAISRLGQVPLPPYIQRESPKESDWERYQTVYARREGSSAAPTAGLHFTTELLSSLKAAGIDTAYITLHVGPGTFLPVREKDISRHRMHTEHFEIPPKTVEAIQKARAEDRPVVAVGTTSVRALEAAADEDGRVRAGAGETALFIYPGYRFRVVDALVTNFHLPRSTLLMLVAAFGGREGILRAYQEAISKGYRFYSYGDAMLIR